MALHRCDWCSDDPIYINYHDHEWGIPLHDTQRLFELLVLEGMQAGLSWITVLKKRDDYRKAFADFNPEKIARFSDEKIEKLLLNPKIIRNRLKVTSIRQNARAFLAVESSGSFHDFIWQFVNGDPITNRFRRLSDVPANTPVSDAMSKTLKKAGFNFVGSTICYAFMQASGMVNDHLTSCFRYRELID